MVRYKPKGFSRIKNAVKVSRPKDFDFSLLGFLLMITIPLVGLGIQGAALGLPETGFLIRIFLGIFFAAALYALWASWFSLLIAPLILFGLLSYTPVVTHYEDLLAFVPYPADLLTLGFALLGILVAPSFVVINQWDKAVVLRLGKYHRVLEPGVHFLRPLLDRCVAFVDTRIRVTDFSAEKILTRDTVPVHVDALAFWMIWDAQKAILEVENFLEAVTLSAQTALRDSIGKYSLTTLLTERETLYNEIQSILDAKTNPWGITILSVEFTDILLPKELEGVMSAQAQAEREKISRTLLSQAEAEIAHHYVEAAKTYDGHPQAMNLRGMSMVFEAMKTRGSMVMVPGSALEGMKVGGVSGVTGLAKQLAQQAEELHQVSDLANQSSGPATGMDPEPGTQADRSPPGQGK